MGPRVCFQLFFVFLQSIFSLFYQGGPGPVGELGPPGMKVNSRMKQGIRCIYPSPFKFQGEKGDPGKGEKGERGAMGLPGYTLVRLTHDDTLTFFVVFQGHHDMPKKRSVVRIISIGLFSL